MAISNPSINPSSEPPITNATTPNTTTPTSNQATANPGQPVLHHRPVGQHAASQGFSWNKPADYHKYLIKTGLPEVHAAVLNGDWAYATEILCAEDIGLRWLPAISQRQASKQYVNQETPHWAVTIASSDQSTQARAIIDMALNLSDITSVKPAGCLYGTNLLTLCLQLPAPAKFTQKVIDLATHGAPAYLSLPDGSGRTPLHIAIERRDTDLVRELLDADADPLTSCRFAQGHTASAYHLALGKGYEPFFSLLLEKLMPRFTTDKGYSVADDRLILKDWVAQHDEEAVRKLANEFKVFSRALFNFIDESGTSLVYRQLQRGGVTTLNDIEIIPLISSHLEKMLYMQRLWARLLKFFLNYYQSC